MLHRGAVLLNACCLSQNYQTNSLPKRVEMMKPIIGKSEQIVKLLLLLFYYVCSLD
jgi:hypothetical protein